MAQSMAADDPRFRQVAEAAHQRLAEHEVITAELAGIQKELERRVSLATKRRGNSWRRRNFF